MFQIHMPSETINLSNRLFRVFFASWVAFSYLGLALFYPATCDPSGIRGDYVSISVSATDDYRGNYTSNYTSIYIVLAEDTLAHAEDFVDTTEQLASHGSTHYIQSGSSSNTSWLLHSRLPASTAQTFVLDVVAVALLSNVWQDDSPAMLASRLWQSQFQHQFKAAPPERPPQLLA